MAPKLKKRKKTRIFSMKKFPGKIIAAAALIIFLVLIFFTGPRNMYQYFKAQKDKTVLEKEIEQLELKKAELDTELTRLNSDPDYVEKIAREKYNMKKKGEKVYKVLKEDE
jgi:cell division protein FtsB